MPRRSPSAVQQKNGCSSHSPHGNSSLPCLQPKEVMMARSVWDPFTLCTLVGYSVSARQAPSAKAGNFGDASRASLIQSHIGRRTGTASLKGREVKRGDSISLIGFLETGVKVYSQHQAARTVISPACQALPAKSNLFVCCYLSFGPPHAYGMVHQAWRHTGTPSYRFERRTARDHRFWSGATHVRPQMVASLH